MSRHLSLRVGEGGAGWTDSCEPGHRLQAAAEKGTGDAGADAGGTAAVPHSGEVRGLLRSLPPGLSHRPAPGRAHGAAMGRPELQNRCAECEQAGLRCARPASNQHAQDEELRPQNRPAARCGGGAAGVQKDGRLPLDVPVPGEGGLPHYARRGAPQIAAHPGTRRVQACAFP